MLVRIMELQSGTFIFAGSTQTFSTTELGEMLVRVLSDRRPGDQIELEILSSNPHRELRLRGGVA